MMMKKLKGKKVLITGASGGIGAAIAELVANRGGHPIMVARSEDKLKALVHAIEHQGGSAEYYVADVTNQSEWDEVLQTISEKHPVLDGLVNNAGLGRFSFFEQMKWAEIEQMIQLNIQALLYTTHVCLPLLKKAPVSHIVNIGSQAGKIATPKSAVYSGTKANVISYSHALRMELKQESIYVTSVNLGPVATDFFELADPEGSYQKNISKFMLDRYKVANRVVDSLLTPKREINMPSWMNVGAKCYQMFPRLMEKVLHRAFQQK